jgi:hypothetical protein
MLPTWKMTQTILPKPQLHLKISKTAERVQLSCTVFLPKMTLGKSHRCAIFTKSGQDTSSNHVTGKWSNGFVISSKVALMKQYQYHTPMPADKLFN